MPRIKELTAAKVTDERSREHALAVLEEVYRGEKHWVTRPEEIFPEEDLENPAISWFLARMGSRPVGVTRVLYEIPVALYNEYQFELVDGDIDVEAFIRDNRIAEIGRFAVVPGYRRRIRIAAILMRAATTETVERGFTHFITDVFEGEPNSPYHFHKGVLGFRTVATHEVGELRFQGRRITMLLDIRDAYLRLRQGKNWIFRYITESWSDQLIQKLMTPVVRAQRP
ncbi:MAG: GNAT family N-acetyltransferase [Thermoanaerobaculia bacterium]|nr:GNAT family N-acetyltransferase [Thermoanaerobaculia bacterium]